MNEFTINVVQDPSIIIDINNSDQTTSLNTFEDSSNLIQVNDNSNDVLLNPSVFYNGINIVYLSGVSGELLHNTFGDLQGGTTGQYYHLSSGQYFNLATGSVVRPSETGNFITASQTGVFYPTTNPSGFITGVDLSAYVTGDVVRPNETGNFITNSQTGVFYPRTNPSGYITGINNLVLTTGNQVISGVKSFSNNLNISGALYVGNSYFDGAAWQADPSRGYVGMTDTSGINTFVVADYGIEAIGRSFTINTPTLINYTLTGKTGIFLNSLTAPNLVYNTGNQSINGVKAFGSRPTVNSTGILLSGEATTQTYVTGISGGLQTQITTINNQTGSYVLNTQTGNFITTGQTGQFYSSSNPSGYITGVDLSAYVTGDVVRPSQTGDFITTSQTGAFYATSNPSGFITGVDLSAYATINYVTGASGTLQTQITELSNATGSYVLDSETGNFYPISNPSGFITGIDNLVYTTGDQNISGVKTFLSAPTISGNQVATVIDPVRTTLTGNGALSAFAISGAGSLTNPSALIVAIDGAMQEPTVDYSVSSGIITFTSPLASGAKAVVISPTNTLQVTEMIPADGSVTSSKLSNDLEISGDLEVAGELTASGQPAIGALTDNDVMTRLLAAYESIINGNQFRQMTMTSSQNFGAGSSGGTNGVLGMQATVTTTLSASASAYTFDNVTTHSGFSGAIMRSNILIDAFFHGCMFRVETNVNFVFRINFGVGAPTRVPPAAGVAAASARQWGVEFYYDGTNYVGRMYWYDTSMNYGTPFIIPNLTAANWTGMVYSIRMKQTPTGLLEFYINSPTSGLGGNRLSDTPTASMQATWTSNFYGGRHINFEAANGTVAAATNTRIHCSTMFCRIS